MLIPVISDVLNKEKEYMPPHWQSMKRRADTQRKSFVWKTALCNSSFISRYTVNNNMDEATILKNNMNCLLQIMKKVPLWVAEDPFGLNELVQGCVSVAREEKVKSTGFMGMGGIASRNSECEKKKKLLARCEDFYKPYAKQLFCWHAFLQPSLPAEFGSLVQEFLKACIGLPLSMKVLDAQLYGRKSKDYWRSQLNKILRILSGEIKQRLQISFYVLDEEEREMFLDVACFFIGEDKSMAIAVWDGSGWSGLHGLKTLLNMCLGELISDKNRIRMHDHLWNMGREIATRHLPYRLWCSEQLDNTKKHSMKRNLLRGIQPADTFVAFKEYTHWLMGNSSRRSKRLRFSNELQILFLKGNKFTEVFASLSEDLVWLHREDFEENLLSCLILKNLGVLELLELKSWKNCGRMMQM